MKKVRVHIPSESFIEYEIEVEDVENIKEIKEKLRKLSSNRNIEKITLNDVYIPFYRKGKKLNKKESTLEIPIEIFDETIKILELDSKGNHIEVDKCIKLLKKLKLLFSCNLCKECEKFGKEL